MHAWRLALAAIGAGALAGALVAAWRPPGLAGADRARGAALAAVVLGGPFFGLRRLRHVRGPEGGPDSGARGALGGAGAGGLGVLVLLARVYVRRLDGRGSRRRWRCWWWRRACYWTNRYVLPRLYPWFHLTLTAAYLAAALLAARLALGRPPEEGSAPRGWTLGGLAVVALLFGWQLPHVLWSPIVRYAAHERTQLTGDLAAALARAARAGDPALRHPRARVRSSRCPRGLTVPTPTSSSSPSTRSGPTTSAPTAIRAPPPRTSTPWPAGACASSGPTPRLRTPRSRWPRC
jgi:hypothetical protein